MADLLAVMEMKPRYDVRTQAAFVRALKFLNSGRESDTAPDRLPGFNILPLSRLRDMNPTVYVCALTLVDVGVEQDPAVIRETPQFRNMIDRFGLQPSSSSRDARNSHKASLLLLEVFTYIILIQRARRQEEEDKAANRAATSHLYEEELTV